MLLLPASQSSAETYEYDPAGRLISVAYDDGSSLTYTYDNAGNILEQRAATEAVAPTTTASPVGGTYTSAQSVTLSCDDGAGSGCAATYYTTDGTDPTSSSRVYTSALSIDADLTLKFFSTDVVGNRETVKSESYVIQITPPNNPPAPFNLVSPMDGATDQETALMLIWEKATDPDGDTLSYEVIYCDNASFTGCSPTVVASASISNHAVVTAGVSLSSLFALVMLFAGRGQRTRLRKQLTLITLIALQAGMLACGSGKSSDTDGDSNSGGPGANEVGYSVAGLSRATTYYWKITANDGNGGTTESETWSFTTQ